MKRSVNELITEFAETQNRLCRITIDRYDLADDMSLTFLAPKVGSVELGGEAWTFHRHGLGFRFTSDRSGRIIDAHRNIVSYPAGFDAWRILQYLETIKAKDIDLVSECGELENEAQVGELLSSLAAQGVITPVEQVTGLYVQLPMP